MNSSLGERAIGNMPRSLGLRLDVGLGLGSRLKLELGSALDFSDRYCLKGQSPEGARYLPAGALRGCSNVSGSHEGTGQAACSERVAVFARGHSRGPARTPRPPGSPEEKRGVASLPESA